MGGIISQNGRTNGVGDRPAEIVLICANEGCYWCPSYRESYHVVWGCSMSAVRGRVK
jgi:hypothetical protein